MRHVVTTSVRHTPSLEARAREVAARTGGEWVLRRGSLPKLLDEHKATLAYVVGRDGESIQSRQGRLRVDVGLLHAKVASGDNHPLIRALGPVKTVVDGTLGLAGDALHISAATGAQVLGAEASPWVAELVAAGLKGLSSGKWAEAASRVSVHPGASSALLGTCGPVDAVFFAPMFIVPAQAAPGYELFRSVADHRVLDADTYAAALSVTQRVVVRVEKHQEAPFPGMVSLRGKAVDYWVHEGEG